MYCLKILSAQKCGLFCTITFYLLWDAQSTWAPTRLANHHHHHHHLSLSLSLSLSLRFNGHFPGEHGLAGVYWIKGWWRWQMDNWSYKSCKAQVKSSSPNTQCFYQVSHSFTDKKSRTFPGLSRTPMKNFPGPFRCPWMFKYKEKKRHLLTIFRV